MRWSVSLGLLLGCSALLISNVPVRAESLEIHPTIYKNIQLQKGEGKKAYVDVVNPAATAENVSISIKALRQVDDTGTLSFYDSEQITKGIKLDLTSVELGPKEAVRIYFAMDGSLLPSGDVFAAIFARTSPGDGAAMQSVQVGSLLMITNGTPASHTADVSTLDAPFIQMGEAMTAQLSLTNPANEKETTGFFPKVTVQTWPYGQRTVEGPLLFAGRTRAIQYRQPGDYFGFIKLQVDAGGKQGSKILFVMTGFWRWLAPVLALTMIAAGVVAYRVKIVPFRRNRHHR